LDENEPVTYVIDAKGLILGRMASAAAEILMQGQKEKRDDRVIIVNAEEVVVSGRRSHIMETYREKYALNHPRKGPFFPRMPDKIVKRTVRGMLPYNRKKSGRRAFANLRVEIGCPKHLSDELPPDHTRPTLPKDTLKVPERGVTLNEICRVLGAPTERWSA